MSCKNPLPHGGHEYLADSEAVTLSRCAGRVDAPGAGTYREVYEKISAGQARVNLYRNAGPVVRLIKVQEEAGEVAQAFIGFTGANARKGLSLARGEEAVAKELADVVIAAMVALHDWVPYPNTFMREQLEGLLKRIKEEGS